MNIAQINIEKEVKRVTFKDSHSGADRNHFDGMYSNLSAAELRLRRNMETSPKYRKYFQEIFSKKVKEEAKAKTQALLEFRAKKEEHIRRAYEGASITAEATTQNFFSSSIFERAGNFLSTISNAASDRNPLSLDDFFKRPVFIYEQSLAVNSDIFLKIAPLVQWTSDPSVRAKLSNYAFLKGDLHLDIVVSSSKYHYGNLLLSYQPFPDMNPTLSALNDVVTADTGALVLINNYLSQSSTKKYLIVGEDNNVDLKLPFICPTNSLHLYNSDGLLITNLEDYEETINFGHLFITSINPIQTADGVAGATNNVTIQVYAWMENIELGPITATNIDITAEATVDAKFESAKSTIEGKITEVTTKIDDGVTKAKDFRSSVNSHPVLNSIAKEVGSYVSDEYTDAGPSAKIASAVSNIVSNFETIPVIGFAAKATSFATGKLASVLKFWGFSKPINIEPLMYAKVMPFSNGCVLDNRDTSYKLTSDPKQELTVEPVDGDQLDPMAINTITSRESYFHTFSWATTDVPRSTILATFPIFPGITTTYEKENTDLVHQLTALSFATLPFTYWRGTITFRFEVIASSFHRGKLMFIYEPNGAQFQLINSNTSDFNQNYICILDLEQERSIEIDCGFVNTHNFAKTNLNDRSTDTVTLDTYFPILNYDNSINDRDANKNMHNARMTNGYIYVRPFTKLVTPVNTATNSIEINCYVKSDDIQYAVPSHFGQFNVNMDISAEATTEDRVSVSKVRKILLNQIIPPNEGVYLHHFGEQIPSFRALLKRDATQNLQIYTNDADNKNGLSMPIYPSCNVNYIPHGASYPYVANSDARALFTLFNYLRFGYLFMKGSFRYKIQSFGTGIAPRTLSVVTRHLTNNWFQVVNTSGDNFPSSSGGSVTFDTTLGGIEFEVPFYSDLKFVPTAPYDRNNVNVNRIFDTEVVTATVNFCRDTVVANYDITINGSIGEDFSFSKFNGGTFYKT